MALDALFEGNSCEELPFEDYQSKSGMQAIILEIMITNNSSRSWEYS